MRGEPVQIDVFSWFVLDVCWFYKPLKSELAESFIASSTYVVQSLVSE